MPRCRTVSNSNACSLRMSMAIVVMAIFSITHRQFALGVDLIVMLWQTSTM